MIASIPGDRDRLHELLAERALFGLEADELTELEILLQRFPEQDAACFDRTAAVLDLAHLAAPDSPVPDRLRLSLMRDAASFERETPIKRNTRMWNAGVRERIAWLTAAAAILWCVWLAGQNVKDASPTGPSLAEAKARLVATADDLLELDWISISDGENGNLGGVVWSDARQEGYLTFRSLPPNDPEVEQYQLWIFDERQDPKYPIDGGVFDVPPDLGDVLIAIQPKLQVAGATQFAVTIERPGGVVVSSRERLPLLAKR